MNKDELVSAIVAKQPDTNKKAAHEALNATLEVISASLAKGESVQLIGFGTFDVKHTIARTGRNPRTGLAVAIPAGKKVSFKVGKSLKDKVNV